MTLTLSFDDGLYSDVHEALLGQADKLAAAIRAVDERLARLPLSERLDREGVDALWIKQLRARETALRGLAQHLSQTAPDGAAAVFDTTDLSKEQPRA